MGNCEKHAFTWGEFLQGLKPDVEVLVRGVRLDDLGCKSRGDFFGPD